LPRRTASAKPKDKRVDKNYIGVTEKIFAVLEYLNNESAKQQAIPFQQVASALPFARTTVHRILYSLQKLGYVEKAEPKAHYRLGSKFFDLTEPAVHFRRLRSVAKSVMTDLLVRFTETVNLGVLDDGQVSYIDVLQSPSALRIAAHPGQRNPFHSTALGKAIVAFLSEEEAISLITRRPLIKMTSKTITQRPHFIEHLASVRELGMAFDLEENLDGVVCVGVPIFDQHGRVVAGLSVSGPASRMGAKLPRIQEDVKEAGSRVSRMLGLQSTAEATSLQTDEIPGETPSTFRPPNVTSPRR
jgi:IclR family acetate operon transcriptional repressor